MPVAADANSTVNDTDTATKNKLEKIFVCILRYITPSLQKQQEVKYCSLFATALATNLAHGGTIFKQDVPSPLCLF